MFITEETHNQIPKKIVSLVPSQTELLAYLRLDTETIGVTKFCIHPPEWFKTKIVITVGFCKTAIIISKQRWLINKL